MGFLGVSRLVIKKNSDLYANTTKKKQRMSCLCEDPFWWVSESKKIPISEGGGGGFTPRKKWCFQND